MKKETQNRKFEHIKICAEKNVQMREKTNFFEYVEFVHRALPGIDRKKIDLGTKFFNKKLSLPLVIEGMTGGHEKAFKINKNLAVAAQKANIAMGIGSQRAMLEYPELSYTYQVKDFAPNIFLIGNIGLPQIKEFSVSEIKNGLKRIGADAIAIHLNYLQETIQKEGDVDARNYFKKLKILCRKIKTPVIAKETGAGISKEAAKELIKCGVKAIDLGGAGGTSWAAVEILRSKQKEFSEFWDWGIPTAASILEVRSVSKKIPLIASGGIRSGFEVAKSFALGADLAGIAYPFFKAALISSEKVFSEIEKIESGLRNAMFLTGSSNIADLKNAKIIITGGLRDWAIWRKI